MDPLFELALMTSPDTTIINQIDNSKNLQKRTKLNDISQQFINAKNFKEVDNLIYKFFESIKNSRSTLCLALRTLSEFSQHNKERISSSQNYNKQNNNISSNFHLEKVNDQFIRLKGLLYNFLIVNPKTFNEQELCDFLFSISCIMKDDECCKLITSELITRKSKISVYNLQELMCSFTRILEKKSDHNGGINITTLDNLFIKFISQEMVKMGAKSLEKLNSTQISSLLRCIMLLGYKDVELLKILGQIILKKTHNFSEYDWTTCITAFTRFGVPLRGSCEASKRPRYVRDWERPLPPKRPKPMSEC